MSSDQHGRNARSATSFPADSLSSWDDPNVASALAEYLAELEAGRRPSREELLDRYSEIAGALADCLDVVEFVHSAAGSSSPDHPSPHSEDAMPPDTILGEYRLVREIGRGGMGIVYEAEQVSLGRRVALKVLSGTAALDPLKLQRFRVETQAVAQLHHAHIVPIFAVGSECGTHYYAMQFIDGTTLAEVIYQHRRIGGAAAGEPEGGPHPSVNGPKPSGPARPRARLRPTEAAA